MNLENVKSSSINLLIDLECRIFTSRSIHHARKACHDAGYRSLYMNEIMHQRLNDRYMWENHLCSDSVFVTGQTKGGNYVSIIAHVPNYCTYFFIHNDHKNSAVPYPTRSFHRLLDMEDNKDVFVIDRKVLEKLAYDGTMRDARHPLIAAIAGGVDKAADYLSKHESLFERKITLHYSPTYYTDTMSYLLGIADSLHRGGLDCEFGLSGEYSFVGVPTTVNDWEKMNLYVPDNFSLVTGYMQTKAKNLIQMPSG